MNDMHIEYLERGEKIYAAKVDSISPGPGYKRIGMDVFIYTQRIDRIRFFWNARSDSADFNIGNKAGSFKFIIENLPEREYLFEVVSLDKFGNKSLPFEVSAKSYGDNYRSGLANRSVKSAATTGSTTEIQWSNAADDYVYSEVRYTDINNEVQTVQVLPTESSTSCPDAKAGSTYEHRSLYVPENSIDTFYMDWAQFYPTIKYDKTGWTAESRGGNHNWSGDGGNTPDAGKPLCVLDGDRTTGWHSNTGNPLPQCLVVDMKSSKQIDYIEIWHLPNGLTKNWLYYKRIEIYLSNAPVTPDVYQASWGNPVGVHDYTGGYDPVTINFEPGSHGQYMILYFPDSRSNTYISFAELEVYKTE
jgi:hypothetical protein